MTRDSTQGFTLIELLVTLALLAMVAAAATPMLELEVTRVREQALQRALWSVRDAIDEYHRAFLEGRIAAGVDDDGYPATLRVLVDGVEDRRDPRHRRMVFLRAIPHDPMLRHEADTPAELDWALRTYAEAIGETAGAPGIYDLHSRSPGTGLNGQPYASW